MTDPHLFVSINDSRICFRCGESVDDPVHADPPQADVDEVMRAPGATVRALKADPLKYGPGGPSLRDELEGRRLVAALPEGYQPQKVSPAELGRRAAAALLLRNAGDQELAAVERDAFYYYGEGRDHRPQTQPEAPCAGCREAKELELDACPTCGRLLDVGTLQEALAAQEHVEGEVLATELAPDRGLRGQATERTQAVLASFTVRR